MLDVPVELVRYLAGLLRAERRRRGTRENTRLATCWKQAVFVLVWFRKKDDIALLGAGFGLSRTTAYRYHAEGVQVLADQAPDLTEALQAATYTASLMDDHPDGKRWKITDTTVLDEDSEKAGNCRASSPCVSRSRASPPEAAPEPPRRRCACPRPPAR
jgi:hypothetical protein